MLSVAFYVANCVNLSEPYTLICTPWDIVDQTAKPLKLFVTRECGLAVPAGLLRQLEQLYNSQKTETLKEFKRK